MNIGFKNTPDFLQHLIKNINALKLNIWTMYLETSTSIILVVYLPLYYAYLTNIKLPLKSIKLRVGKKKELCWNTHKKYLSLVKSKASCSNCNPFYQFYLSANIRLLRPTFESFNPKYLCFCFEYNSTLLLSFKVFFLLHCAALTRIILILFRRISCLFVLNFIHF